MVIVELGKGKRHNKKKKEKEKVIIIPNWSPTTNLHED